MSGKDRIVRPDGRKGSSGERRRRGVVVHDERGNARLEWVDAPHSVERTSLTLQEDERTRAPQPGYDPYANDVQAPRKPESGAPRRAPRDLRKLSEWIKQMRRLEALKRAEDDDTGEKDPQA
jgi:hypothetical protein